MLKSQTTRLWMLFFALIVFGAALRAQDSAEPSDLKMANAAAAAPAIVHLVYREIPPGRIGELQQLESTFSRLCDRFDVPNYWVDWHGLTGYQETMRFSPLDSFEQMGQMQDDFDDILASHPDLAQLRTQIDALISSRRTVIAVRRDDLGYLADTIDLSEARYLRVVEVFLLPGHESDFAQAMKIRADLFTKLQADVPWVVYQAEAGTTSPTFLILTPMMNLMQNDDLLQWEQGLEETAGEEVAESLRQIARQAYASTDSNLYAVSPRTSHVSKEFSSTDPGFWRQGGTNAKPEGTRPETKSEAKPEPKPQPKAALK